MSKGLKTVLEILLAIVIVIVVFRIIMSVFLMKWTNDKIDEVLDTSEYTPYTEEQAEADAKKMADDYLKSKKR